MPSVGFQFASQPRSAIIYSGLCGPTLPLTLRKRGVQTTLYERSPRLSAGNELSARTASNGSGRSAPTRRARTMRRLYGSRKLYGASEARCYRSITAIQ